MRHRRLALMIMLTLLPFACGAAAASDYAASISAYRRTNKLSAVKSDRALELLALRQAEAMSRSGQVSHSAGGAFTTRIAGLRRTRAAENIGAGFLSFDEMFRQGQDSRGHRENLLMPGARRVGVASVSNPRSPYRKFWAMLISD